MKVSFASAAAALAMSLSVVVPPPPVPVSGYPPAPPELTAATWVLYDATAGVVLDGFEEEVSRSMASVTKVMTALVARDHLDLEERIRITPSAAGAGESEIGLVAGERWSVSDLLYALLVRSANDAAVALAERTAGSVPEFAELMNAKAAELGLEGSAFVNPHGLDAEGHYASALDLAKLGALLLEDEVLAEMVRTKLVAFKPAPNGAPRVVVNTNRLLGSYPGVAGVKTGFTGRAGLVLISALETPERTIIGVVMGSTAHFDDSRELLDYGERLLTLEDRWQRPLLLEQGGSGVGDPTLDEAARTRLQAVPQLHDGQQALTQLSDTAAGHEIESQLRAMLPVVLGGSG